MQTPVRLAANIFATFVLISALSLTAAAQTPVNQAADKPYAIEYYYKVKWGYTDEFLLLFKKNHYPVLKRQVQMGRMLSVKMDTPVYHMTEDARWDYRVTIVFKNSATATTPFDEDTLKRELFSDQATFTREEQRRFDILLAHWDLPLTAVDLDAPQK